MASVSFSVIRRGLCVNLSYGGVAFVSVLGMEAWPLCQSQGRRRGLCVSLSDGDIASASLLVKEVWPLYQFW